MKNYKILLVAFIFLAFFSCSEDKGNYNYIEKDQIEFDLDNMESEYSLISFKDTLDINPILKNVKDENSLEFLWIIFPDVDKVSFEHVDTISTDRILEYPVELPKGKYFIQHKVIDKSNGDLMSSVTFDLLANTEFSEGFYVLKETSTGNTDMDLFTSTNKVLENLILKSNGVSMNGKPVSFGFYPTFSYLNKETDELSDNDFLMPISESDFAMIRLEDMKKIRELGDMFYNGDPGEKPLFFYPGLFYFGCVTEDNHYQNYQAVAYGLTSTGAFGLPDEIPLDDYGYSFDKCAYLSSSNSVFFDNDNGRFVNCDYNGGLSAPKDIEDTFKCTEIEDEFVYIGGDKTGAYGFAIFDDVTDGGRKMYYLSNLGAGNPVDSVFSIASELKMNSANMFSVSRTSEKMLYYVSENKIYNYSSVTEEESELNFEGLPADREITYLENIFFRNQEDEELFDYLVVGTYKDGDYSVYLYETLGGIPLGEAVKVLEGEGKVAKIQYVHPELKNSKRDKFTIMY